MKKLLTQGALTIVLFFSTWFVLEQIAWEKIFHVQQVTDSTEQKLGDLFWDVFKQGNEENTNKDVVQVVDSLVNHICAANEIDSKTIEVHILNTSEVNAFALPGGRLIINSGLILNSENQEELAGVISHEIAHIELNHVMKKLIKEVGLSVLISITTGGSGGDMVKETAKLLSSTAFDRSLEKEADMKAVDYLIEAKLDPEPFAHFLYRLSENESEAMQYVTWMSTHPESKERAKYLIEYSQGRSVAYKPILSQESWENLQATLKESDESSFQD